jgi:hypothetical protein
MGGHPGLRTVIRLPHYYSDVPPVASSIKGVPLPAVNITSLRGGGLETAMNDEHRWLENIRKILEDAAEQSYENVSWAAFHANCQ